MSAPDKHLYEFGTFRLDVTEYLLLRAGERVPLSEKAFETLLVLVRNSGQLVSKEQLMQEVWPDTLVEGNNLDKSICALRHALGEKPAERKFIETVRRRGYRFVAEVKELNSQAPEVRAPLLETLAAGTLHPPASGQSQVAEDAPLWSRAVDSFEPANERVRKSDGGRFYLALAAVGLLVLALAFLLYSSRAKSTVNAPVKTIAVLPFKSLSQDENDEYLGLGMTDALITRLGHVKQLTVRPTSSVRKYATMPTDPVTAGKELNVEAVLEGSIQRLDQRLRVTVQLISISDGRHLWSDKFDAESKDIFTLQDSISERLAEALALELTGAERELLVKRYTENSAAYKLYLQGRYHWNKRTPEGFQKSREYFTQAIQQDPNYALAYAGLADSYNMLGEYTVVEPGEAFPKARAAAEKALSLDEKLAEAHTSLALVGLYYDWDFPSAEREFQRALELNPGYATAHQWYGELLMVTGRFDESLREMRRALELDPLSLIGNTALGYALWHAHRYDEAIEQLRKTLEMEPNFPPAVSYLGMSYEQKGMTEEAVKLDLQVRVSHGDSPAQLAALKEAYARSGYKGYWRARVAQDQAQGKYVAPIYIALMHALNGEREQALSWLEKAYQERSSWMPHLRVDPRFDMLRSDPRFQALLQRIGFTDVP